MVLMGPSWGAARSREPPEAQTPRGTDGDHSQHAPLRPEVPALLPVCRRPAGKRSYLAEEEEPLELERSGMAAPGRPPSSPSPGSFLKDGRAKSNF